MKKFSIDDGLLQRIERLASVLKNNTSGAFGGNHTSKSFGSSCEYTDFRNYVPGDDISKIDWNAFARSDELYLKLYRDERQLHTRIYIDASRSMDYGDGKKAETAIGFAATLAYLSVCELDRVSIYTVKESRVDSVVTNLVGRERFYNEIGKLNDIEFGGDCFISDGILPSKVGYGDGLSVIVSDFLTDNDYESAIDYLVDKKRDLLCVQTLTTDEINPQERGKHKFFDSENINNTYRKNINMDVIDAYRAAVGYVQERIRSYCTSRGASYILAPDNVPIDQLFYDRLTAAGVMK